MKTASQMAATMRGLFVHWLRLVEQGNLDVIDSTASGLCSNAVFMFPPYRGTYGFDHRQALMRQLKLEVPAGLAELWEGVDSGEVWHWSDLISYCALSWEHWSGNWYYPIPGGHAAYTRGGWNSTLWAGEQGAYRRQLAGHIADMLEREEI